MGDRCAAALVGLDLSTAFNTIDYEMLIVRLRSRVLARVRDDVTSDERRGGSPACVMTSRATRERCSHACVMTSRATRERGSPACVMTSAGREEGARVRDDVTNDEGEGLARVRDDVSGARGGRAPPLLTHSASPLRRLQPPLPLCFSPSSCSPIVTTAAVVASYREALNQH
ncbi:unnamed protein product [Lampetra fluviatilis]